MKKLNFRINENKVFCSCIFVVEKNKIMKNIHDKFVKERLLDKQNAVDFLKIALPAEITEWLIFDQLNPTQNSFITEDIRELFSDIVYECKLITGYDSYCCILVEHKSYKDPLVGFQLGSYIFSGYQQQIKNKEPFKIIIPLIFYHHEESWSFKPVESYFENFPEVLMRFIPGFDTIFFDVKNLSDQTIENLRNMALSTMFITQKHHPDPGFVLEKMGKIFESLQTLEERNSFHKNFVYFLMIHKKNEGIIELIKKDSYKPVNKVFMTIYEYAVSEGLRKGKMMGIEEGKLEGKLAGKIEGKLEGKAEIILKGFDEGLSLSVLSSISGFTEENIIKILKENKKL